MSVPSVVHRASRFSRRVAINPQGFRTLVPQIALAVVAGWVVVAPSAMFAQEAPNSGVNAVFIADTDTLTVGDIVTLTLGVNHPADHIVVIPRLGPQWGAFEVISQTASQTAAHADGTATTVQLLRVTLFAPGTFETPNLPLTVRGVDGDAQTVSPLPARLTVNSVLSGSNDLLIDIRPPSDLSLTLWQQPTVLAIVAFAVVVALVSGAYMVRRRLRVDQEQIVQVIDTRTPRQIGIDEIDRIERLDLPRDGHFKEHYTLIASVVQTYVRSTYLENAGQSYPADMTTDEIESAIGESSLGRNNARLILDLLTEADFIRFSSVVPPESQADEALRRARGMVEGTSSSAEQTPQQEATAWAT